MPIVQTQVIIPMDTNLTEDFASNTFYWFGEANEANATDFGDALDAFYGDMAAQLSSLITPARWTYKHTNLADPLPRLPFLVETGRGPATTGTATAPTEVALCISFRGAYTSGIPAARVRGRVYIGPLAQTVLGSDGRPPAGTITALRNAGDGLLEASQLAPWTWVVYSPTTAAGSSDFTGFDVVAGWVDNEFDTQRRRGRQATSRSLFPVP